MAPPATVALAIADLKKANLYPDNDMLSTLLEIMLHTEEPINWDTYWKEKLSAINSYWKSCFSK